MLCHTIQIFFSLRFFKKLTLWSVNLGKSIVQIWDPRWDIIGPHRYLSSIWLQQFLIILGKNGLFSIDFSMVFAWFFFISKNNCLFFVKKNRRKKSMKKICSPISIPNFPKIPKIILRKLWDEARHKSSAISKKKQPLFLQNGPVNDFFL